MKKLLEQNDLLKPYKVGEIIKGRIIGLGRSSLFIDLGAQGAGIVYGKEFYEIKNRLKDLKVGDDVFAKIIDLENEEGYIELSLKEADKDLTLEELKKKKEKGETIKVKILGANKGGLLTQVIGLPAFLPVSQLAPEHYPRIEKGNKDKIFKELQKFVGQELTVKIFDLDLKEKKLVLSEKAIDSQKIKELLRNYKVGDVVEGEITGIVDFGAFIKFPLPTPLEDSALTGPDKTEADKTSPAKAEAGEPAGTLPPKRPPETLEGLVHISELDWRLVENPSEAVKIGQKVKAKIIEISQDRISLSLKALRKDPWEEIEKNHKKGDIIKGRVTKFNPFGAFVVISSGSPSIAETSVKREESAGDKGSPEIQGLVHISEFGSQKKMEESLKIGKEYTFEITMLDPKEHKMILKLKNV